MENVQKFGITRNYTAKRILLLIGIVLICLRSYSNSRVLTDSTSAKCIIETASKEVGVRENGRNNSGTRIAQYLAHTKIYKPSAWCSSFVAFILSHCGIKHSVNAWSPSATAKNRIYDRRFPDKNTIRPVAGDVFTLYYPNLKRIGHTGFVQSWNSKWVHTIEGNTSEAGTRETTTGNDGVFRRKRLTRTIYQVSRWN
jgi:hypothetical protein